jgi:hypothetical protein
VGAAGEPVIEGLKFDLLIRAAQFKGNELFLTDVCLL